MAVEFPKLPYDMDALSPVITKEIIEYHYNKHHKGYVDNTNRLISGTEFEDMTLNDIILNSDGALFNNAAQAFNHEFYWLCMTPDPKPINKKMKDLIERDFGSFEDFKEEFIQKAATLFGSGWCWLELDVDEKLIITQRSNSDTPILDHHKPLLTCDVWEHAYYLEYKNERKRYIESWFDIIDWKFVASNIVDYYHDLTEVCRQNSELCDYIDELQNQNEVNS